MSQSFGQTRESAIEQIKRLRDLLNLPDICQRWIVAGSVRRQCVECHDIDLVAIARFEVQAVTDESLLIQVARPEPVNLLLAALDRAMDRRDIHHTARICWGSAKRRFIFEHHTFEIDLCDETAWPVLVAVRTGPEKFTKGLVTQRHKGGMLPDELMVGKVDPADDSSPSWRVWRHRVLGEDGKSIIEPGQQLVFDAGKDDREFIELCCGEYVEPRERR